MHNEEIMLTLFFRPSPRKKRMEYLAKQLGRLLDEDFPAAYKSDNPNDALARIRREERLIETELSALRLLQSEDRLVNYLLAPILSSVSLIIGGVVGYLIKLPV